MNFTWGHVFLLAEKMFFYSDQKLAEKLGVSRTTIHRHKKGKSLCFEPQVKIYEEVFAPPDAKPETLQGCFQKLSVLLDNDTFPEDFRKPKYGDYRKSIEYLVAQADETGRSEKKKQSSEKERSDADKAGVSFQEQADEGRIFQIEEAPEFEIPEPKYYLEYNNDRLNESFGMYDAWNIVSESLNPDLAEKWGSVCVTDEFCKSIKDYGIEDFLKIAPSDLLPMRRVVARDNVNHIRNTVRFLEHMEPAMDHMMITNENKEIFFYISQFTWLLHRYLRLLIENSNNSDLFGNEFILMLSDDSELERTANEYYGELKFRFEDLKERMKSENERKPN